MFLLFFGPVTRNWCTFLLSSLMLLLESSSFFFNVNFIVHTEILKLCHAFTTAPNHNCGGLFYVTRISLPCRNASCLHVPRRPPASLLHPASSPRPAALPPGPGPLVGGDDAALLAARCEPLAQRPPELRPPRLRSSGRAENNDRTGSASRRLPAPDSPASLGTWKVALLRAFPKSPDNAGSRAFPQSRQL